MKNLNELILDFIDSKREDTYWDFKQEWHKNNADLLHDIICLANADYKGDRFLIFGITDPPECKIVGIENDTNRKDQAKIIDFLSQMPFSGDIRPNVSLKTVTFPRGLVDVIVISDEKYKPFTLSEVKAITSKHPSGSDYTKSLYPGAIYTRVRDKNTAFNRTADIYFVERMWRERFGFDLTPLDRMQKYLIEFDSWKWDGIDTGYYKYFPEFTIFCAPEENENESTHWWHRWPANEASRRIIYEFKFHNTIIDKIKVVRFDRESFSIPFPDIEYIPIDSTKPIDAFNTYCFYYYDELTLRFSLLIHIFAPYLNNNPVQKIKGQQALRSPIKPPLGFLPFPIFSCSQEKEDFLDEVKKQIEFFWKMNPTYPCNELGKNKQIEEEAFSFWAYDLFWKWKNK